MLESSDELDHLIESSNKVISRYDTDYHIYKSQYPIARELSSHIASGIYISDDCDGNMPCKHYIIMEYNSKPQFNEKNIKVMDFYSIRRLLISNAIALPTHFLETEEHRSWRLSNKPDYLQLRSYHLNSNSYASSKTRGSKCCSCCNIM
jgi:hypothetical protein